MEVYIRVFFVSKVIVSITLIEAIRVFLDTTSKSI